MNKIKSVLHPTRYKTLFEFKANICCTNENKRSCFAKIFNKLFIYVSLAGVPLAEQKESLFP